MTLRTKSCLLVAFLLFGSTFSANVERVVKNIDFDWNSHLEDVVPREKEYFYFSSWDNVRISHDGSIEAGYKKISV